MTLEEKRAMHLVISQMLADAGLNQQVIKEMVEKEIKNKVDRAINQALAVLDSQCSSGNYIKERVDKMFKNERMELTIRYMLREELSKRIIQVVLRDVEPAETAESIASSTTIDNAVLKQY